MRLRYFDGENFGDALNPMIFNKILPSFFDDQCDTDFFGIGSIIGFEMMQKAQKKVIFSSGYSPSYAKKYGTLKIDSSYDIVCVRGPMTVKALNLPAKSAVTDGAALLREFNFPRLKKKYSVSFMPHWTSEQIYPWNEICEECGIHFVSPRGSVNEVINEILQSEVVMAEAMHYAIVADALRVPWIPVKAYSFIDAFKWSDWSESLGINYRPHEIRSMYSIDSVFEDKLKNKISFLPQPFIKAGTNLYGWYQKAVVTSRNINAFTAIKQSAPLLSKDSVFNEKTDTLLELLNGVKRKYSN